MQWEGGVMFRPHNLAAHLIAKTFLTTDEIGKTMVWSDENGWRLTDEGDTVFPEHREILNRIYEFMLRAGMFGPETEKWERIAAVEEIEMEARKIDRPDVCKIPVWGAAEWDIFGTLE